MSDPGDPELLTGDQGWEDDSLSTPHGGGGVGGAGGDNAVARVGGEGGPSLP